jgi:uncharacterized membrane protein YvbJ
VFCSECGAPNPDEASFCGKCGNPLRNPSSATPPQQSQPAYTAAPTVSLGNRKDPVLAGVLNLFIGIGYLYLGYRKVFGLSTLLFVFVLLLVYILLGILSFGLLPLILAVLLAYDGYVKAKGEKGYVSTEPALLYH